MDLRRKIFCDHSRILTCHGHPIGTLWGMTSRGLIDLAYDNGFYTWALLYAWNVNPVPSLALYRLRLLVLGKQRNAL